MARSRAEDFEDKQRSILVNAAAVLAQEGLEKASMALIAQRAGVSKSLLYHYYPAKDTLIFAIISTHLEELLAEIAAADDASLAPDLRLRRLVGTVLEAYRGADDAHKVQLNATATLSDDQRALITEIERQIVRRFSNVLRELNPALDQSSRPLLMPVTMSLFGIMNWVYMWFRDGGKITREDYADLATTLVLEGIKAVR